MMKAEGAVRLAAAPLQAHRLPDGCWELPRESSRLKADATGRNTQRPRAGLQMPMKKACTSAVSQEREGTSVHACVSMPPSPSLLAGLALLHLAGAVC